MNRISFYERTTLKKPAEKYPDVTSVQAVEALFEDEKTIDLLGDVVEKYTEWPCIDHSIKTPATYLGFIWRDENPSGAASIEWDHSWVESGACPDSPCAQRYNSRIGDDAVRQRIPDDHEDG